jgi:Zn-dependent peptidase ImmA (M78 family)
MGDIHSFRDVINRIRSQVNYIRKQFIGNEYYKYPTCIPIAHSLGLSVTEKNLDTRQDGFLAEKIIVINRNIRFPERNNFTFFHEISHHLLEQDDDIISFMMEYHAGKDREYSQYIEKLCNIGAAQFLAPLDQVREFIQQRNYSITLIKELDIAFPASKPALLFQLAQATPHKCTLVIVEKGFDNTKPNNPNQLLNEIPCSAPSYYTLYATTSPSNKYWPGRFVPLPKHHILVNAFESNALLKGEDFIPYQNGNQDHRCYCEGILIGSKVYGLFNLESPHVKDQPPLFDTNEYL